MMSQILTCPYCNSRVTLNAGDLAGPRVRCPRCGDTFPHDAGAVQPALNGAAVAHPEIPPAPGRTWSNAAIARALLAGMAVLAVGAVVFVLVTVQYRRSRDPKPAEPEAQVVPVTPPGQLAALGYLPADSTIVAGLHVAELWQDERHGRKLLEQLRKNGGDAGLLTLLEQKTGLEPRALDHLVLGVRAGGILPQAVLVVQTRQPYDRAVLAKTMLPAKADAFEGKPVYRFSVNGVGALLYCAGDRTLIVQLPRTGARLDDLKAVPEKPAAGASGLPEAVREHIEKRVPKTSPLWVAGSLEPLRPSLDMAKLFLTIPPETADFLTRVKTFSAGVRLEPDAQRKEESVVMNAELQTVDEKAARALTALLDKERPRDVDFKVVGPPPGASPEQQTWVSVQVRGTETAVLNLLPQLPTLQPGIRH